MKLNIVRTANRRITNIEPQNVEGWNRFAQSFFRIDRIHYFDIRHSLFDIRYSLFRVSFPIRLAVFLVRGGAHMKLRQNGTIFLMIKLAASMAGPGLNSKQIERPTSNIDDAEDVI
jgi:hypothetical protein